MKNIYCIVGPSGVGKTTVLNEIIRRHPEMVAIESYTDRLPRYAGETGHTFVTPEEFTRIKREKGMVAYTEFCGHRYGVTADMIDTADLYVIDPAGVITLKELYRGRKGVYVIGLMADTDVLTERMKKRGDSEESINRRLEHDSVAFEGMEKICDSVQQLCFDDVERAALSVEGIIFAAEYATPTLRLYQINERRDKDRVMFMSFAALEDLSRRSSRPVIDRSIYDLVWEGDLGDVDLDEVFYIFNSENRPNKCSRSLSVSDIVEVMHNPDENKNGVWFCDSFGWKKVGVSCYGSETMVEVLYARSAYVNIGEPAKIHLSNGDCLTTSVVEHIINHPSGCMEVITQNSHYKIIM